MAEWCSDGYDPSYGGISSGNMIDPTGPKLALKHTVRGGDFTKPHDKCRAGSRLGYEPHVRIPTVGFRVVMDDLAAQPTVTPSPTTR